MMFNQMGSVMRPNPKYQAGRVSTSKNQYAQLYERALQDKIQTQLFQQQHEKMANGNRHTPSSASFNMSISTLELIEFVLREYEQNNSVMMQPVAHKKQSYTIYEDLKIVYSLGKDEGTITTSSYKRLAEEGYVRRTLDSIKSRYVDYLKNLTKEDYQNILSFIDLHGLKGFLIFEKNDKGVRLLQKIQKNDPRVELANGHQGNNNSANHTPVRSPRGTATLNADRPLSPSMFGHSPSKHMPQNGGFMPYYYPQFPMYPPHQGGNPGGYYPDARMSPYKQFFEPAQQMYPMNMFMNPFMQMNPQFHQMMAAQQRRFMMHQMQVEDQEAGFEVRPSFKRSATKTMEVEQEEIVLAPELRKKAKGNQEDNQQLQSNRIKDNSHQMAQTQSGNNNLLKPPQQTMSFNANKNQPSGIPKMQSNLIYQKPYQPIPPVVSASMHPHLKDTELRSSNVMPRALTKEVYDLISDEDRIPAEQFEIMLEYVADQIKMPKDVLIEKLDALSGSFKDFAVFLETKQENMLWNSEEDKILESIQSQDSSEFKLLLKLKGLPSIKKRIIYSNIEIPFRIQ